MVWNHDLHLDGLMLDEEEGGWFGVYIVNCGFHFVVYYMFLKHGRHSRSCSLDPSLSRNDDKVTSSDWLTLKPQSRSLSPFDSHSLSKYLYNVQNINISRKDGWLLLRVNIIIEKPQQHFSIIFILATSLKSLK